MRSAVICLISFALLIGGAESNLAAVDDPEKREPLAKFKDLKVSDEDVSRAVEKGIKHLLDTQLRDGGWSSEECTVLRRRMAITGLACMALRAYPNIERERSEAAQKLGLEFLLKASADKLLKPVVPGAGFDWSYFSIAYTVPLFLDLRQETKDDKLRADLEERIKLMMAMFAPSQQNDGGWAYKAGGSQTFVTAIVIQTMLDAKDAKFDVDEACLKKAMKGLRASRAENGAYPYRITSNPKDPLKGTLGRSSHCETILLRAQIADITVDTLKKIVDDFFEYNEELAKVRKSHSHRPPYSNAGYYFYWGHYYGAQAIAQLPAESRVQYYAALTGLIVGTQDKDGSFIDSPCGGKPHGTAMALLTLKQSRAMKGEEQK